MEDDYELIQRRGAEAQAKAAHAYSRLLELAENRESGQVRRIARFLAATFNSETFPLDLFELRAVDVSIGDDMLACIDAVRWAKADLHTLVPGGERRVLAVLERWGIHWPEEEAGQREQQR